MYNPTKKIAALSHIDANQNISQTINLMTWQLARESDEKLFVYLSTGEKIDNITLDNIKDKISSNNNIELKNLFESESMIMDASTGEVKIDVTINSLDQMDNYLNRLETRTTQVLYSCGEKFPCKVFFDNRKSIISSDSLAVTIDQLNKILGQEVVKEIQKGIFSNEAFKIVCNQQTKASVLKNLLKDIIFPDETIDLKEISSSINDSVIIPKTHEEFFVDYCSEHC